MSFDLYIWVLGAIGISSLFILWITIGTSERKSIWHLCRTCHLEFIFDEPTFSCPICRGEFNDGF